MNHISEEVTEMWLKNRDVIPIVEPPTHTPTSYIDHLNDEEIVGFESDAEKIINYLIGGTKDRDLIPVVGMGGQGKTTIARKVYNNREIVSRFDVRAWCCISQTYNRIELLREIHGQVSKSKLEVKDDELAHKLKKLLMGKRYLIVLDDMWDVKAWEDLGPSFPSFPHCEKGCRIIVTTREVERVARKIKHHTDPYSLPFLTPEESSELLKRKVFQKEGCPHVLEELSREVATKCNGLPLVVVLAAGIIKRKKAGESWWLEVKDSLYSYIGESKEKSTLSTLRLSYNNLPGHIRPCLLYMGMFPEDASVPVSKLISLWIAEGFVQSSESGSLEEAAESYLMDLISSNVVMISKRTTYNGKVKYCKVHDVVHHFCLETGRTEMFMLAVNGHCSQFKPCDWKGSQLSFNFIDELSKIALLVPKAQNPVDQQFGSMITTASGGYFSNQNPFPFPQVIKLTLLKVLDLSSHEMGHFSSATLNPLIHLKYLAVLSYSCHFHPDSLLVYLETMILRTHRTISVPTIFWEMKKLRHVEIRHAAFDLKNNKQQMMEESFKLENLRILRQVNVDIDDAKDYMDVLFDRCPNLQQLEISVFGCTSLSFNKLESLTHLTLYSSTSLSELHLPLNLNKLVLRCPDAVTTTSWIAKLPSLEYLKLVDSHDESDEWCLGDDIKFPKLKCLKLRELRISRWYASEDSFPLLETLDIESFSYLKEIPCCFTEIETLKQIKLSWLGNNKSLMASALKIKKEVKEYQGCDRIDVIIDGKLVRDSEDLPEDSDEECDQREEHVEYEEVEESVEYEEVEESVEYEEVEESENYEEHEEVEECEEVEEFEDTDEDIVGFEDDANNIIRCLIGGTEDRDVIPIVGMGGQGKTTIARKVYNNDKIVSRFDVRAWCCITQTYNRRELFQEILNQLSGYKVNKVDEPVAADRLRKSLMGKRYLVVLDDMWDGMAWDDLRLSFPDCKNGSRIIVTTRLKIVGEHVKHHTDPYFLPFLTLEESAELLLKKVFHKEGCPPELRDVSLQVAERCKGLPLAVVLVAGIIRRKKAEAS